LFEYHRRPCGPYKIIIIVYVLSRNLMFVLSSRKFGRGITLMREKSLFLPIESPQLYSALFNPFLGHFSRGEHHWLLLYTVTGGNMFEFPVRRVWPIQRYVLQGSRQMAPLIILT
jgi:hypothetical protein